MLGLDDYIQKENEIRSFLDDRKYYDLKQEIGYLFKDGIGREEIKQAIGFGMMINGYINLMKRLNFEGFNDLVVRRMLDLKLMLSEKFKTIVDYRNNAGKIRQDIEDILSYSRLAESLIKNTNMPDEKDYERDLALLKEIKRSVIGYEMKYACISTMFNERRALREKSKELKDTIDNRLKREYLGLIQIEKNIMNRYNSLKQTKKPILDELFFCEEQLSIMEACSNEIADTIEMRR